MARVTPDAPVLTIGSLLTAQRGINLVYRCGHKTSLLPAQIAAMAPARTRVTDFKRRFRCSSCGRSGASVEIRLSTFDVPAVFADPPPLPARRRPN